MGIFSVDKSAKNQAMTYQHLQVDLQNQQRDVDFGRQLLSNIRQQRLATEELNFANYSDVATSSSASNALANINSTLASEVGYAYDTGERQELIQDYAQAEQDAWEEYADSIKNSQLATTALVSVAGLATGGIASALGAGILGTMAATAVGGGLATVGAATIGGGGSVAGQAGLQQTIKSTLSAGANQYLGNALKGLSTASEATAFQQAVSAAQETGTLNRIASVANVGSVGGYTSIYNLSDLSQSFGIWGSNISSNTFSGIPFSSMGY